MVRNVVISYPGILRHLALFLSAGTLRTVALTVALGAAGLGGRCACTKEGPEHAAPARDLACSAAPPGGKKSCLNLYQTIDRSVV